MEQAVRLCARQGSCPPVRRARLPGLWGDRVLRHQLQDARRTQTRCIRPCVCLSSDLFLPACQGMSPLPKQDTDAVLAALTTARGLVAEPIYAPSDTIHV